MLSLIESDIARTDLSVQKILKLILDVRVPRRPLIRVGARIYRRLWEIRAFRRFERSRGFRQNSRQ